MKDTEIGNLVKTFKEKLDAKLEEIDWNKEKGYCNLLSFDVSPKKGEQVFNKNILEFSCADLRNELIDDERYLERYLETLFHDVASFWTRHSSAIFHNNTLVTKLDNLPIINKNHLIDPLDISKGTYSNDLGELEFNKETFICARDTLIKNSTNNTGASLDFALLLPDWASYRQSLGIANKSFRDICTYKGIPNTYTVSRAHIFDFEGHSFTAIEDIFHTRHCIDPKYWYLIRLNGTKPWKHSLSTPTVCYEGVFTENKGDDPTIGFRICVIAEGLIEPTFPTEVVRATLPK